MSEKQKQKRDELTEIIIKASEEWLKEYQRYHLHLEDKSEYIAAAVHNAGYRKQSEVASAIFAELDCLMLDGAIGGKYATKVINPDKYAELKKKYTEGEK